jgi:hypothetical protein
MIGMAPRGMFLWSALIVSAGIAGAGAYLLIGDLARPSDVAMIQIYYDHAAAFAQAADCPVAGKVATDGPLRKAGVRSAYCDHEGALHLVFTGNRLGPAVGAGWSKGLTHLNGDGTRRGVVVGSTDVARRMPADIYLKPIENGWYVFYQRDD